MHYETCVNKIYLSLDYETFDFYVVTNHLVEKLNQYDSDLHYFTEIPTVGVENLATKHLLLGWKRSQVNFILGGFNG